MSRMQTARETVRQKAAAAALAGAVLVLAGCPVVARAQGATEPDVSAPGKAAELGVDGGQAKSWWQQKQERRRARAEAYRAERRVRQPEASRDDAARAATVLGADELSGITVSFLLDRRLTRGLHMGDRWVSPATYSGVQDGVFTVDVRAQGRDTRGQPGAIDPDWTATDPGMVTVSPARGKETTITVHRAGESRVRVVVPAKPEELAVSTELAIKASYQGTALEVEITPQATTILQDLRGSTVRNGWRYVSGEEPASEARRPIAGHGWRFVEDAQTGEKPADLQDQGRSQAR